MTSPAEEPAGAALIDAVDDKVSAVRTRSLDISFNELVDMYKSGELQIQPDFQRLFRWTEGAQSRLIESLILELPLPPIYMLEVEEGTYELIDGLQRISSYLHFRGELRMDGELQPPFALLDCDIVPELNGLTYEQLPRAIEIKLKRNFIRAEILRKESDKRLRYYMFKRLNTGGTKLEDQEIRNCTIRLLSDTFNSFRRAPSLSTVVGEMGSPVTFDAVFAQVCEVPRFKDEFETTSQFDERQTAARARCESRYLIESPVDLEYVRYDADRQLLVVAIYALMYASASSEELGGRCCANCW